MNICARTCSLLDDRGTGQISSANMGAFLLEVYSLRGLGFHELARLQDLMEEAAARTPEEPNPSLSLSDFKVRTGSVRSSREGGREGETRGTER